MPHDGRAQAGVSEPPACEADVADTGSPPPVPEAVTSERTLTFAGVALTAVYVPGVGNQELRLVETAGCAASEYGLPERLLLSGDSPPTHALRTGRPLWLNPAALTDYSEGGPTPPRAETSLAALPLAAEGGRLGCLVVVGPSMDGVADTALLVVSELVTNGLVHTQGPVRVDLVLRGDRVRVCVSDCSPRAPAKQVWSEIVMPRRERVPADSGPRTERGGLP
jgi:hypothetical protein